MTFLSDTVRRDTYPTRLCLYLMNSVNHPVRMTTLTLLLCMTFLFVTARRDISPIQLCLLLMNPVCQMTCICMPCFCLGLLRTLLRVVLSSTLGPIHLWIVFGNPILQSLLPPM